MITLGMEPDEIMAMYKTLAGILHFGNIEVKQRPRDEWATIPTTTGQPDRSHIWLEESSVSHIEYIFFFSLMMDSSTHYFLVLLLNIIILPKVNV